ncbi:MAG TPA: branched-chain amino acid ABC transporter substrate-binding protein [Gaiellaceae bacterium]|nr:branched-chain amino acid ABC transporter substrate-binding protein [Gaiellaceae bacterium]
MTAKKSVLAVLGLLVAALAFVAAGCGGGDGGGKTLKIVSDLPLQGSDRVQTTQMNEAIQFILEQADNKAGDYTIEFEAFDDATAAAGKWDEAKCAENARTFVDDESIVGNIGTYNSGCAAIEIPILNEAGLGMVSPANTYQGLTVAGPGTEAGEPDKYYPSGTRNYVRVVAHDLFQGKVGSAFMKDDLGVTKVFILDDKELYGKGVADAFEGAAKEIGLEVVGHEGWDKDAPNYTALMTKIKATGADGIYLGGVSTNNGGQLVKDKVAIVGDNEAVKLLVSDGFVLSSLFEEGGINNVNGAYGTAPTQPPDKLTGAGAQFITDFKAKIGADTNIEVYTVYAAAAAQVLLDAIARSDGTREDIVAKLFETNLSDSVFGSFSFDENGDPAAGTESIYKAEGGSWVWQQAKAAAG